MVTLNFHCDSQDGNTIKVSAKNTNQIYIGISDCYNIILGAVVLDKQTAIKFSKELRKQIALLKD